MRECFPVRPFRSPLKNVGHVSNVPVLPGNPARWKRAPRVLQRAVSILCLVLAAWGLSASSRAAAAHHLVVFATVEEKTIAGEAYVRGGGAVADAAVTVLDSRGEKLGETTTDGEGMFRFEVRFRCDHRLVVDAGAGHRAEYTVSVDELPDDLPPRDGPSVVVGAMSTDPPGESVLPESAHVEGAPPSTADLEKKVDALGRQVTELRKDLDGFKNELRIQDVLGGIGYILGLMGLAFYFLGLRRRDQQTGK